MVGLLLAVTPFVLPRIPVGTDLLKHVMVARVLDRYHDPMLRYDQSFELLVRARSTALSEIFLAGLERLVPPLGALKVFMVAFVVLLWAAGWRLMKRLGAPFSAALVLLPLAHTFSVFSGLLPYVVSIALFPFCWLLSWIPGASRPRRRLRRLASPSLRFSHRRRRHWLPGAGRLCRQA